jgi:hypothetical protein
MTFTPFDLGWMVGNFDGEGSVYHGNFVRNGKRRRSRPYLQLGSTDEWIVDRWVEITGGRKNGPYTYHDNKPLWQWRVTGDAALSLARALYPHMCPRRQEQLQPIFDYTPRKPGRPAKTHETPCSVDGCDKQSDARGWCNMHWQRWRRHGDPAIARSTPGVRNAPKT